MARGRAFNLTAEINLRGPANIRTVVADIRRQLGTVTANVNLNINPTSVRTLNNLSRSLQNLNRILPTTTTNLTAASAAMRDFASAVGGFNPGTMVRDLTAINTGMQNFGRNSTNVGANIAAARTEMEEFGRQSALAIRRFAAFSAPTAVIFGLTNAVRNGISAFIDFDTQLVKLQQVTGETRAGLSDLSAMIASLAKNYGVASSELTNVSLILAQAGLTARDTEKALKALALSSLAPSFDNMNDTVEGSIALMKQFGISAGELEQALGAVNAVAAGFAVEASDIISAIQRTGGVFATASKGVSEGTDALNEFIAVFTSVRATTRESAETIATGLRTIFTRIQRSSTIEALKEYGVTLTDAQGKFVGAYKAIQLLSEGLNRIDPRDIKFSEIVEELGGFRQIGKVIPLIQQFATAQEALKVAQRGQASLSEDAAIAQLSLANKVSKVREEFLALFREIGDSDSFQVIARGALDLASALIKVADSVKGILPLLTVMLAVRTARAVPEFISGFAGGISRQRQQGGRGFAKGGMVPVALTPGEAVFYPDAVNRVGVGNLRKMNHADRKAYAKGGGVGIVPGSGNSDSYYTSLPAGSFVVRKSATNAIGHSNIADIASGRKKYAGGGPIKNYAGDSRLLNRVQLDRSQLDKSAGQIFIPEGNQANRLNPGDKFRFNIVEKKIDVNKLNQSLSSVKYYNDVKGNDSARGKAFEKVLEQVYGVELSQNPTARLDGITRAGTPVEAKSYKEAITEQEIGRKIIGSAIAGAANSKAGAKLGAKLQAVELNSKINTVDLGAVRLYTDLVTSASGLKQEKKKKKQQREAFGGLIQKFAEGSSEPLKFPGRKQYLSAFESLDQASKLTGINRIQLQAILGQRSRDPDVEAKLMDVYSQRVKNVTRARKGRQTREAGLPTIGMLAFEGKQTGKARVLKTPEGKKFRLVKGVMDPKLAQSFSDNIISALTPVMQKEVVRFAGMQGLDLSGMKPDRMTKILTMMRPQLIGALGEALVHGVGGTEPALTKKGRAGGLDLPTGISPAVGGMFNLSKEEASKAVAGEIKKGQTISKKRFTAQVGRGLAGRAFGGLIQKLSRGDRVGVFDFDMTTGITEQKETPSLSGFKNPKLAVPDILEAKPTGLLRLMREYGASSVLTARSGGPQGEMRSALQTFFNKNGILVPSSRLITLGDQIGDMSTPEKKARSLFEMVKKYGRGKVDFFDDDPRNIEAARDVKGVNARRVKVRRASGGEIPIMAQKGEYVINKHSAKNIGYGNLETLNKYHSGGAVGNVQKLAGGGFVQKFLFGGTPRPQARPDLGGAAPGTEAANKLLGVSNSVTASLNKLAESLNQLGVSSSSSAAIIRKGNQVSYDAAIKAYESDIKRAQVAGASAADIIAMETQLSNIRKQAERSGKATSLFKNLSGETLQKIEDKAAKRREQLTEKERKKIESETVTKGGVTKRKYATAAQVEEELGKRAERINSNAYRQATLQVTKDKSIPGSGLDVKGSGIKGSDVQEYIRNSMRDSKTLAQMDKQYVIQKQEALRNEAAYKTANKTTQEKMMREVKAAAEKEVQTRRQIVNNLANQSGAVGPDTAAKNKRQNLMAAGFILPMFTSQLASAFDKTASEFSAKMSSAIESFGNTFGTGTFLATSGAELLPERFQALAGGIGIGISAVAAIGSAMISARNATIEFAKQLAQKKITQAIEDISGLFGKLEKDLKNIDIQKQIKDKITLAADAAQQAINADANIAKAFWVNFLDVFVFSGDQQGAAQRSKILEARGIVAYGRSTDIFGGGEAQRRIMFQELIPDIARQNAKLFTDASNASFQLIETQLKTGTKLEDILQPASLNEFANSIAGASAIIQQEILTIQNSGIDPNLQAQQIQALKLAYAEQEIRKRAAIIAREKAIQEADKTTNLFNRSLERMFQNMDQALAATTFRLEEMNVQLDATVAALSGQAKISKTSVRALDVLRNPRAYGEADQTTARKQAASFFTGNRNIVEGLLSIGDNLEGQILATINKTVLANPDANNEQVAAAIQTAVNKQLADLALPDDVSKKLAEQVKDALADLRKSGEEKLDFTQIVEKIPQLSKVVDSARAAQERAIKVLEFWQSALNNYAERINQAADAQIEANSRFRRANQILINSQLDLNKALGKEVTVRQMMLVRNDEIRAQTGGAVDPQDIFNNILRLERQRAGQEAAIQGVTAQGPGPNTTKNFIELNNKLKDTNISLRENYDALKNLAENTELASAAMNKVQEIQQKQQGRASFLEKLVTSTPTELEDLRRSFIRLQNNMNGQINTIDQSVGAQRAYLETLKSGGNIFEAMKAAQEAFVNERRQTLGALNELLPFLGEGQKAGQIRANVLEAMMKESGIAMTPLLSDILKTMRNPEADPQMKEAIDQYKEVVRLQADANKKLGKLSAEIGDEITTKSAQSLKKALEEAKIKFENAELSDIAKNVQEINAKMLNGADLPAAQGKAKGGLIYAAQGQMVDFQPKGSDTVPAMLTPGEFVVNKRATQANLPLLNSINNGYSKGGRVKYYADGGMVGNLTSNIIKSDMTGTPGSLETVSLIDPEALDKSLGSYVYTGWKYITAAADPGAYFSGNIELPKPNNTNWLPGFAPPIIITGPRNDPTYEYENRGPLGAITANFDKPKQFIPVIEKPSALVDVYKKDLADYAKKFKGSIVDIGMPQFEMKPQELPKGIRENAFAYDPNEVFGAGTGFGLVLGGKGAASYTPGTGFPVAGNDRMHKIFRGTSITGNKDFLVANSREKADNKLKNSPNAPGWFTGYNLGEIVDPGEGYRTYDLTQKNGEWKTNKDDFNAIISKEKQQRLEMQQTKELMDKYAAKGIDGLTFKRSIQADNLEKLKTQLNNVRSSNTLYEAIDIKSYGDIIDTASGPFGNFPDLKDKIMYAYSAIGQDQLIAALDLLATNFPKRADLPPNLKDLEVGGNSNWDTLKNITKADWATFDPMDLLTIEKDGKSFGYLWTNKPPAEVIGQDFEELARERVEANKEALGFSSIDHAIDRNAIFASARTMQDVALPYQSLLKQYKGKLFGDGAPGVDPDDPQKLGDEIETLLPMPTDNKSGLDIFQRVADFHNKNIYPAILDDIPNFNAANYIGPNSSEQIQEYIQSVLDGNPNKKLLKNPVLISDESFIRTKDTVGLGLDPDTLLFNRDADGVEIPIRNWVIAATDAAMKGIKNKEVEELQKIVGGPVVKDPLAEDDDLLKQIFKWSSLQGDEFFTKFRPEVPKFRSNWLRPIKKYKTDKSVENLDSDEIKGLSSGFSNWIANFVNYVNNFRSSLNPKDKRNNGYLELETLMRGYSSLYGGIGGGQTNFLQQNFQRRSFENIIRSLGAYEPLQAFQAQGIKLDDALGKKLKDGLIGEVDPDTGKITYKRMSEADLPTTVKGLRDLALNPYNEFTARSTRNELINKLSEELGKLGTLDTNTLSIFDKELQKLSEYYGGIPLGTVQPGNWYGKDYIAEVANMGGVDDDTKKISVKGFSDSLSTPPSESAIKRGNAAHKFLGLVDYYGQLPDEKWLTNRANNFDAQFLARGGMVYASKGQIVDFQPKGTDTVPAMLTPGEFVINKQATKENLGLLHAINNGYSAGGLVYLQDGGQPGARPRMVQARDINAEQVARYVAAGMDMTEAQRTVEILNKKFGEMSESYFDFINTEKNNEELAYRLRKAKAFMDWVRAEEKAIAEEREFWYKSPVEDKPGFSKFEGGLHGTGVTLNRPGQPKEEGAYVAPEMSRDEWLGKPKREPYKGYSDSSLSAFDRARAAGQEVRTFRSRSVDKNGKQYERDYIIYGVSKDGKYAIVEDVNGNKKEIPIEKLSFEDRRYLSNFKRDIDAERAARLINAGMTPGAAKRVVASENQIHGKMTEADFDASNTPENNAALAQRIGKAKAFEERMGKFAAEIEPPVPAGYKLPQPGAGWTKFTGGRYDPTYRTKRGSRFGGTGVEHGKVYAKLTPRDIEKLNKKRAAEGKPPLNSRGDIDYQTLTPEQRKDAGITLAGEEKDKRLTLEERQKAGIRGPGDPELSPMEKAKVRGKQIRTFRSNVIDPKTGLPYERKDLIYHRRSLDGKSIIVEDHTGIKRPVPIDKLSDKDKEWVASQPMSSGGVVYAANGRMINFQPKGTDTIPAMLTPGEFVVNKQATQQNLGLLQSINNGDSSYMSRGGIAYLQGGGQAAARRKAYEDEMENRRMAYEAEKQRRRAAFEMSRGRLMTGPQQGAAPAAQAPQPAGAGAAAPQINIGNLQEFTKALNLFDSYITRLENIKLPDRIELTGEHTVTVQIQGAAALESMSAGVRDLVMGEINKEMNKIWNNTGGELGTRMA